MQFLIQTNHIWSAQQPHMARAWGTDQHRWLTSLWLLKILLACTAQDRLENHNIGSNEYARVTPLLELRGYFGVAKLVHITMSGQFGG